MSGFVGNATVEFRVLKTCEVILRAVELMMCHLSPLELQHVSVCQITCSLAQADMEFCSGGGEILEIAQVKITMSLFGVFRAHIHTTS